MREKILTFIEKNSRIDTQELAVILGVDETAVMNELEAMEQEGIICGYHTLINWDKAGVEKVTALIEVRVTPQRVFSGFLLKWNYSEPLRKGKKRCGSEYWNPQKRRFYERTGTTMAGFHLDVISIAAVSTSNGGRRELVLISGNDAFEVADRVFRAKKR